MSLPVPTAPVAVLVLAWDEATPAVRALVEPRETTSAFSSVVVVVPGGAAATAGASPQELRPGAAAEEPAALATAENEACESAAASGTTAAANSALDTALAADFSVAEPPAAVATPAAAPSPSAAPASPHLLALPLPLPAPLAKAAVRVLRLGSFSLAALAGQAGRALPAAIWAGAGTAPAAPYLGSVAAPLAPPAQPELDYHSANQVVISELKEYPVASGQAAPSASPPPAPMLAAAGQQPEASAPAGPLAYLPAELPDPAAALEQDFAPATEVEDALPEFSVSDAAAAPAASLAPPHAGWPEALAALQQPTALNEADAPAANAETALAPANEFSAPDLNFQVIQYARFTVPLALAAQPFGVIYAPAWPTWLAAQELRQRTGQPLVLHITTLAAGSAHLETATGWQAELQRQALRRADLLLAETPALAQRLRHELGLPAALVQVVPAAAAEAIEQALAGARPSLSAAAS